MKKRFDRNRLLKSNEQAQINEIERLFTAIPMVRIISTSKVIICFIRLVRHSRARLIFKLLISSCITTSSKNQMGILRWAPGNRIKKWSLFPILILHNFILCFFINGFASDRPVFKKNPDQKFLTADRSSLIFFTKYEFINNLFERFRYCFKLWWTKFSFYSEYFRLNFVLTDKILQQKNCKSWVNF